MSELESLNIDTEQLLGLIKNKDSEDDEFAYEKEDNWDLNDAKNGILIVTISYLILESRTTLFIFYVTLKLLTLSEHA